MKHPVTVRVNGQSCSEEVEARTLLVHFLRERLGLTGTHVGCVVGECGACSVLVDGALVKSCLMLAVQVNEREVTTIEGLARDGRLHPVQEAFVRNFALQCGFCTPGFVMASLRAARQEPGSHRGADPQGPLEQPVHVHRVTCRLSKPSRKRQR